MRPATTPQKFMQQLWQFYCSNGRHNMAWRVDTRPYYIVISEIMLQQTQVERVKEKFTNFIRLFPTCQALAAAKQSEVIKAWQGLGYNRRALYLHKSAQLVMQDYHGNLPDTQSELEKLPGIGPNTAGAIMAFAYNKPIVFIETNIRRVLLHKFFPDQTDIADKAILPILEEIIQCLAESKFSARTFYWAMMDYGSYIKSQVPNPNRRSKHYTRQSQFVGSDRQIRGQILRVLVESPLSKNELRNKIGQEDSRRLAVVLAGLQKDGFITMKGERLYLV